MFTELIEYCRATAIKNTLNPSEETLYRSICRAYSKSFYVPLPQVFKMDMEEVIQTILDDRYESMDVIDNIEVLLDQIYTLEDPSYKRQQNDDFEAFAQAADAKEQKRINKNNSLEKTVVKNETGDLENKPTGGSVDFSNVNDEEKPGKF